MRERIVTPPGHDAPRNHQYTDMTRLPFLRILRRLSLATIVAATPLAGFAQENVPAPSVPEIIYDETGGAVEVEVPADILQLIMQGVTPPRRHTAPVKPRTHLTGRHQGYRIQVFSDGRNPSTLQARARARGNSILGRFPKYRGQVYTFSRSPNWFTQIGNFATQAEANAALAELKRAFPAFAGEMRTVRCQVILR